MPFTLAHGLISYFIVCAFTKNKNYKMLAFVSGMLPDLDGIPILYDMDLYYKIHHELFHPPIYGILLAVPGAIILNKYFQMNKTKAFLVFAASFILHPITDVLFTNWPVKLLWPFSQEQYSYPIFIEYNILLVLFMLFLLIVQEKLFPGKKK